jgi:hypothetical protein
MGDESEPKTRVWELNWPFQELGDEIDPRPRVGGRKWLFCQIIRYIDEELDHRYFA